jgi:hypothetical protein
VDYRDRHHPVPAGQHSRKPADTSRHSCVPFPVHLQQEEAHSDTSRVDTAQRVFPKAGNFDLNTPLKWKVHGESFAINS